MKRLALALAVLVTAIFSPVRSAEVQGNTITLSDEEQETCMAEGGCVLATRKAIAQLVDQEVEKALVACRNHT